MSNHRVASSKRSSTYKNKQLVYCNTAAFICLISNGCLAADSITVDDLLTLSPEQLFNVQISSIATGTPTPINKSAAVVSVITEQDILAIGATDLDEILETVPGLHVSRAASTVSPKYVFRGITSTFTPQTLLLVNGIPLKNSIHGIGSSVWGGMPVKAIKRIEVIRGPGSALYGADAFAGVINIITKSGDDINGTELGGRLGSFDTQSAWLLHGTGNDQWGIGLSLEYSTTDGHREIVAEDAQTSWDKVFATNISNAPGPIERRREMVESRLDIRYGQLQLRGGYQGRYNLGTETGIAQALDPQGSFRSDRINVDLTHTADQLVDNWRLVNQLSYFHGTQEPENNQLLFPAGAFGGAFPNGFIGNPGYQEEQARYTIVANYLGFDDHRLTLGSGYQWVDLYEVTETKNFDATFAPHPDGLVDVSDTDEVWLPEVDRTNAHAFIQDEWQFTDHWQLTSGIRYDHFSDFGDTINPRLALVWEATRNITTKLIYGSAFRAPNFIEQYAQANPVAKGNSELEPETIDTYELVFDHRPDKHWNYSVNLFYYEIEDFITFIPEPSGITVAQNIVSRKGLGGEFELSYKVSSEWVLLSNYAYQRATDKQSDAPVGDAPSHEIYVRSEWGAPEMWQISPQLTWVGEQKRVAGDSRGDLSDYTTVDITVRNTKLFNSLGVALSVRNLFDANVREPSPGPVAQVPGDIPMQGISVYGELSYQF